jgi:predicted aminopeptidase
MRFPRLVVIATIGLSLGACGSLRYYAQAVRGQSELVVHRQDVSALVGDPATEAKLATRLALAQQARRFASEHLGLPDNHSYTRYVDLHRNYVVWNVFSTPRYSVEPELHCFPIAGCVAYRGYFAEADARAEGARLKEQGEDVEIGGVSAYSTLGWFADPILSTMLRWDDDELDSTIFHELAHQLIYVKDDSAFNESFATFVQDQGLREWRESRGLPARSDRGQLMEDGFTALVLDLRDRLKKQYASGASDAEMEVAKQREIRAFRARYAQWRDAKWPQDHAYDAWVNAPINNARMVPFGLYDQWVPAFAALFSQSQQHWPIFYARVRELVKQPRAGRDAALERLSGKGTTPPAH